MNDLKHEDSMHLVEIITFSGCPTGERLYKELKKSCDAEKIDIKKTVLTSAEEASEYGLYGTPSIRVNGQNYQEENCRQKGVYCRLFDTESGKLGYPDVEDIIACCENSSRKNVAEKGREEKILYPLLMISRSCAFTKAAKNLWSMLGDEVGGNVHTVDIEENNEVAQRLDIGGVPCLVTGPGKHYYGIHFTHSEAKTILFSCRVDQEGDAG